MPLPLHDRELELDISRMTGSDARNLVLTPTFDITRFISPKIKVFHHNIAADGMHPILPLDAPGNAATMNKTVVWELLSFKIEFNTSANVGNRTVYAGIGAYPEASAPGLEEFILFFGSLTIAPSERGVMSSHVYDSNYAKVGTLILPLLLQGTPTIYLGKARFSGVQSWAAVPWWDAHIALLIGVSGTQAGDTGQIRFQVKEHFTR